MSVQICHRHDCAFEAYCAACNLQEKLTKVENEFDFLSEILLGRERECEKLEAELTHAKICIERLESGNS
jgi:hypothetical protein